MNSFDPHRLDQMNKEERMSFYLHHAVVSERAQRWQEVDRWRSLARKLSFAPVCDPDEPKWWKNDGGNEPTTRS